MAQEEHLDVRQQRTTVSEDLDDLQQHKPLSGPEPILVPPEPGSMRTPLSKNNGQKRTGQNMKAHRCKSKRRRPEQHQLYS